MFLDRDGTLNAEVGFVRRPADLRVLPGVVEALQALHDHGFRIIVLTNQSGIARGLYTEADLAAVHARLHEQLRSLPEAYLHCPHHPEQVGPYGGPCRCRKPGAGLLQQAHELLGAGFAGSVLIGDSARDLLPARGLPLLTVYVHSGKPPAQELAQMAAHGFRPHHEAEDLAAAVAWVLSGCAPLPTS